MGSESSLWTMFKRSLEPFGALCRIENIVESGMPDVVYALRAPNSTKTRSGFVELKHMPVFPTRLKSSVTFPSLTLEQVLWAERWHKAGGRTCIVGQIADAYLIIPANHIRPFFDGVYTREQLWNDIAPVTAVGHFPIGPMLRWLTRD